VCVNLYNGIQCEMNEYKMEGAWCKKNVSLHSTYFLYERLLTYFSLCLCNYWTYRAVIFFLVCWMSYWLLHWIQTLHFCMCSHRKKSWGVTTLLIYSQFVCKVWATLNGAVSMTQLYGAHAEWGLAWRCLASQERRHLDAIKCLCTIRSYYRFAFLN